MLERKKYLYKAAVMGIAVLWPILCAMAISALRQTEITREANVVSISASNARRNALRMAEKTHAELVAFGLNDQKYDNLYPCLLWLEQSNNDAPVFIMDGQGELKNTDGIQGRLDYWPDTTEGYALVHLPEDINPGEYILLIIPMRKDHYIARGYTPENLAAELTREMGMGARKMSVYGHDGHLLWESQTQRALSKAGGTPEKHRTIDVPLELGWTLQLHVPATTMQPVIDYRILLLGMVIVTIAFIAILQHYRKLSHFREIAEANSFEKDQITGLYSRDGIELRYNELAAQDGLNGYNMVCMDIIAFSHFNTIFGYDKGDRLLRTIAGCIGERCISARSHGGMFTMLVPPGCSCVNQMDERVNKAIKKHLHQDLYQLVSFKYGICSLEEGMGFAEAQDRALLALAEAKEDSKLKFVVYEGSLQKRLKRIKGIEENMSKALDRHELIIYIQPIVATESGACLSGEMLVRWKSPEIGFLAPDQFIPYFEKNGFITELDLYMLDKAFGLINRWKQEHNRVCRLSVNLSQVSLTFPNYIERMVAVAAKYPDVRNNCITIELTESTLAGPASDALAAMSRLREMGFIISMDDFGTGYSSLIKLKEMPIDILKLDRGFLKDMDISEKSEKIIRHITNMAKELDIMTICEGVETNAHLDMVRRMGCTAVQGYYFSRPLPWDKFEREYVATDNAEQGYEAPALPLPEQNASAAGE